MLLNKTGCSLSILLIAIFIPVLPGTPLAYGTNTSCQYSQSHIKPMPPSPDGGIVNLTFKSKVDGSPQPLLVKIPAGYNPTRSWPLLVTLHGMGDGPILAQKVESMIQIGPYGRGSVWYTGIGESDVFEAIEITKKLFSIDRNRIYLCGFSMGGAGTFNLGLRHPDIWAACVPVCGRCSDMALIENGRHLPFWINTGRKDTIVPPISSKKAYDTADQLGFSAWKYTEYDGMAHSFNINWKQIEDWLLTKQKHSSPNQISFCTKDLNSNRCCWVEITGIEKYGEKARINAAINGRKINIKTENISNYTLNPDANLIDLNNDVEIFENGKSIFNGSLNKDARFIKTPINKIDLLKRPALCGPIWDTYSASCILVYGTNCKTNSLKTAAKNCAGSFLNPRWMNKVDFKILADTNVKANEIAENNLVLFGNTETNKILAQISDKLPIQMNGNQIRAGNAKYTAENIGYILIYPNPLNSEKYVTVFSGNTAAAIDCFDKIWPNLNSTPKNIDYGIFELNAGSETVQWKLKGLFGTNWNWQ